MGQNIDRSTLLRHWTKGVQFVLYILYEMIAIGHVKSHMHFYHQRQTINFLFGHVRIDMSEQCLIEAILQRNLLYYVYTWAITKILYSKVRVGINMIKSKKVCIEDTYVHYNICQNFVQYLSKLCWAVTSQ